MNKFFGLIIIILALSVANAGRDSPGKSAIASEKAGASAVAATDGEQDAARELRRMPRCEDAYEYGEEDIRDILQWMDDKAGDRAAEAAEKEELAVRPHPSICVDPERRL